MTASETVFDPCKFTLQVIPYIKSVPLSQFGNFGEVKPASVVAYEAARTVWYCEFEFRLGQDSFSLWPAEGVYIGEHPEGPKWEEINVQWQAQYDYLRQNIGHAVFQACAGMVKEAMLAQIPSQDWDALTRVIKRKIGELHDSDKTRGFDSGARYWLLTQLGIEADCIAERLTGNTILQAGSRSKLRYRKRSMQQLWEVRKEYQKRWADASVLVRLYGWSDSEWKVKWEEIKSRIRQQCGGLPDDLLDYLRPDVNTYYKPHHLALVHAARECDMFIAGGSNLMANNYGTIKNELEAYASQIGETLEPEE